MDIGIYAQISHEDYHRLDYISHSYLQRLNTCPANAKVPVEETPAMLFGRAFHVLCLEGLEAFDKGFYVIPNIDKRTKDGKALYKECQESAEGRILVSVEDFQTMTSMVNAIFTHPFACKLMAEGRSEQTIIWEEDGQKCKARPDRIPGGDHGVIVDVKTAGSADSRAFTNACLRYGYAMQAAMYITGFNAVCSAKVDAFVFVVVEKEPPYRVEVYTLEDAFIQWGISEFQRLLALEIECRERNFWPHFQNAGAQELYLPNYY
jgi:exodeoxyribonuclease VIII